MKEREETKIYINNFCNDLNYKNIVLYIGGLSIYEQIMLERYIKRDKLSHMYEWNTIINNSKFFYVENCDLQSAEGYYLYNVMTSDYKIYGLHFDEKGFYYILEDEWSGD